jgi:hypothetical protein
VSSGARGSDVLVRHEMGVDVDKLTSGVPAVGDGFGHGNILSVCDGRFRHLSGQAGS